MLDSIERTRRLGILIWTIVGGLIVAGVAGWLLWKVQIIWLPIVLAFAIVYLLNPLVTRLRDMGLPRPLGAAVGYLVFGAAIAFFLLLAAPTISEQTESLVNQFPTIADDALTSTEDALNVIGIQTQIPTYDELVAQVQSPDAALAEDLQGLAGTVFSLLGSLAGAAALLIVTPVIAFYLLVDAPRLGEELTKLIPEEHREEMTGLGHNLARALGGFVRGQLFVALIVAVLAGTGLYLLNVELWLVLGIIAGVTNMIPFVGPWISGIFASGVSLVLGDLRLALGVAALMLAVQQVENHVIGPLVLRATVKLHPVLIILALLVGGSIGGFLGLLLAVPLTAALRVLIAHFWRTRMLGQHWEEASQAYVVEYGPPAPDSLAGRLTRVGGLQLQKSAAGESKKG